MSDRVDSESKRCSLLRPRIVCLALCVAAIMPPSTAQAWPWKKARARQNIREVYNPDANGIFFFGLTTGGPNCACTKGTCNTGACPPTGGFPNVKFPFCPFSNCFSASKQIPGQAISANGIMYYSCATDLTEWRTVGWECNAFADILGPGAWFKDALYKGPVPIAAVATNSPVKLVGMNTGAGYFNAQNLVYSEVEYHIAPLTEYPLDGEWPDVDASWVQTPAWDPVTLAPGQEFDLNIPLEQVGDHALFVRGMVSGGYTPGDLDPEHMTTDHQAGFVIQIYGAAPVPAVSVWGVVILTLFVLAAATVTVVRRGRIASAA